MRVRAKTMLMVSRAAQVDLPHLSSEAIGSWAFYRLRLILSRQRRPATRGQIPSSSPIHPDDLAVHYF